MLFTNTTLQDQILYLQDTPSLTTLHGAPTILITLFAIGCLAKLFHGLMITRTSSKIWLATLIAMVVAGAAGAGIYYNAKSKQSEAYQEITTQQHDVLHTMQTQLIEEYDILDAVPVLQHGEGDEKTTTVVNEFADVEHLDEWFQHLAKDDVFRPSLISVITPATHENHLYMVRFADDGETVVLQNTPHAAEAPPVDEIAR